MHRRSDRDRYLELATPSQFACVNDQFVSECSLPGVQAQIGVFDFTSLMFTPGAAKAPAERCALEPDGSYLYLPRGVSHSLENTGDEDIRLLGAFHPSGSPAVRYDD